jgi:hypothetical protein
MADLLNAWRMDEWGGRWEGGRETGEKEGEGGEPENREQSQKGSVEGHGGLTRLRTSNEDGR